MFYLLECTQGKGFQDYRMYGLSINIRSVRVSEGLTPETLSDQLIEGAMASSAIFPLLVTRYISILLYTASTKSMDLCLVSNEDDPSVRCLAGYKWDNVDWTTWIWNVYQYVPIPLFSQFRHSPILFGSIIERPVMGLYCTSMCLWFKMFVRLKSWLLMSHSITFTRRSIFILVWGQEHSGSGGYQGSLLHCIIFFLDTD